MTEEKFVTRSVGVNKNATSYLDEILYDDNVFIISAPTQHPLLLSMDVIILSGQQGLGRRDVPVPTSIDETTEL